MGVRVGCNGLRISKHNALALGIACAPIARPREAEIHNALALAGLMDLGDQLNH